jgi:hypothetical protein
MNVGFDVKSIHAQWVLGLIAPDDLPDIAINAIAAGLESKSIVELAGLSKDQMGAAPGLFEKVLNDLGLRDLEKKDALKRYAKLISTSILASDITPLEGAKRIWRATIKAGVSEFHDLDGFIYAASELEDRPEDKAQFEKAIFAEAARWKGEEDAERSAITVSPPFGD